MVQKRKPIAGFTQALDSIAVPLFDENGKPHGAAASDAMVLDAIEHAIAGGANVLLQVMDSSKFGWRAPSDRCLEEITARWGDQVQIVVDACQMRLGRPRLKRYLARGYIV